VIAKIIMMTGKAGFFISDFFGTGYLINSTVSFLILEISFIKKLLKVTNIRR